MASPYRYEERILKAAREHFAAHGFYGARVDAIADEAKLNKRMVYEYNHTKEGLYLAVLSRVSCDAMALFEQSFGVDNHFDQVIDVYDRLLDVFRDADSFVRLWTWEQMAETIHGPRLLETVGTMLSRIRTIVREKSSRPLTDDDFSKIEMLLHGHLLSMAMYLANKSGNSDVEVEGDSEDSGSELLDNDAAQGGILAQELRGIILNAIKQVLNG